MRTVGERLRTISAEGLQRVIGELEGAGEHWDLTDIENPVTIRKCRSCHVELRFDWEGGVRPELLYLLRSVVCEECGERERAAEESAQGRRDLDARVKKSGMPPALYAAAAWDELISKGETPDETLRREEAITAASEWAQNERPSRGILLYGSTGTGKTRLAATAARERLQRWNLTWVSVGVLAAQLEGAWDDDERKAALKVLTSPGPVVLDDFDKVPRSGKIRAQLFTALDKREAAGSTMLVTTNLAPAQLQDHLGEVITSRLLGMCNPRAYPGPDLRMELGE